MSIIRLIIRRLISLFFTLLIITAFLYGIVMLTPVDVRASLYYPKGSGLDRLTEEQLRKVTDRIIESHHLNDPYPVQYITWLSSLIRGDWGFSPTLNDDVLSSLIRRTPVTAELAIYSLLFFIPFGLLSGVIAARQQNKTPDLLLRFAAFIANSVPPFILALVLLAIFYVALHWFPPERLSLEYSQVVKDPGFHVVTGLMTIDGLLNSRLDVTIDALRHLVLPVLTLSLYHWATLGRLTRAKMIEELKKEYIIAGLSHGLPTHIIVWRHAFRNVLPPALSSSAISAASVFTGVYIVERIFNIHGLSEMFVGAFRLVPDISPALGMAIYSVAIVLLMMFILDILQALLNPYLREMIDA